MTCDEESSPSPRRVSSPARGHARRRPGPAALRRVSVLDGTGELGIDRAVDFARNREHGTTSSRTLRDATADRRSGRRRDTRNRHSRGRKRIGESSVAVPTHHRAIDVLRVEIQTLRKHLVLSASQVGNGEAARKLAMPNRIRWAATKEAWVRTREEYPRTRTQTAPGRVTGARSLR